MKVRLFLILLIANCFLLSSFNFKDEDKGSVRVNFSFFFDQSPLQLNSQYYIDANRDTIYIDVLRFYISNIQLKSKENINFSEKESYHLIDAEKKESTGFAIQNIPAAKYDFISFDLGIDSVTSCSGAMGGDLDPVKGMYWEWNSGYINAKLEGHSPSCKTLHHAFEFHIGGYRSPHYAIRRIILPVKSLEIKKDNNATINIKTNAAEWFKNPSVINISILNAVMMPGKDAMMIANNYSDMFSIE